MGKVKFRKRKSEYKSRRLKQFALVPGYPSYTRDVAKNICRLLSKGWSLQSIERRPDCPTHVTIMNWVHNDVDGFRRRYDRARSNQADYLADQTVDIADGKLPTRMSEFKPIERDRLRVAARQWKAGGMSGKWGQNRVTLSGDPDSPIVMETARDAVKRKLSKLAERLEKLEQD